ncbi:MAG: Sec-independent protein translocase subunit TatA/TatB [Candidatus Dormibacteria bacterium]
MLSPTHIALLAVVLMLALVVFGPKRLPELGHSVGRAIQEFKHASSHAREELSSAGTELRSTVHQASSEEPVASAPVPSNGSASPESRT